MRVDFFPQVYCSGEYRQAIGGLAIWHLVRSIDAQGRGWVVVDLMRLAELLKVHPSTIRRWLHRGQAADLFVFRFGREGVWVMYRSWVKVLQKAGVKSPIVSEVPAAALRHGSATATLALTLGLQKRAYIATRKNEEYFANEKDTHAKDDRKLIDLEPIIAKHKGGARCIKTMPNGKQGLEFNSRTRFIPKEPFSLPGITVELFQIPVHAIGKGSPKLFCNHRFFGLAPQFIPYGVSQERIAEKRGMSVRTIRRHQRESQSARRWKFNVRRLCIVADGRSWFGQKDVDLLKGATDAQEMLKIFNRVYWSRIPEPEQLLLRRRHRVYRDFWNAFDQAQEVYGWKRAEDLYHLNYPKPTKTNKPTRQILRTPVMNQFKILPVVFNITATSCVEGSDGKLEWRSTRALPIKGYTLVENLTNVYGCKHIFNSPHEGYIRKEYRRRHKGKRAKSGRRTLSFCSKLAELLLVKSQPHASQQCSSSATQRSSSSAAVQQQCSSSAAAVPHHLSLFDKSI